MRNDKEIYAEIDKANNNIENGEGFYGMSYEDGVKAALEWISGITDVKPMDDYILL
jgi:hypothetical protein